MSDRLIKAAADAAMRPQLGPAPATQPQPQPAAIPITELVKVGILTPKQGYAWLLEGEAPTKYKGMLSMDELEEKYPPASVEGELPAPTSGE